MNSPKEIVWLLWLGTLAALFFGRGWLSTLGGVAFLLTLGAHLVEFLVYRPLLKRVGGSMAGHFIQALIYGLLYLLPIKQSLEAESSPARQP